MKRGWFIVLLLSLGLNLGLGVSLWRQGDAPPTWPESPGDEASPGEPGPGFLPDRDQVRSFMERRLDRMSEDLGLTDDQRSALMAIHLEIGDEVFSRRRELLDRREELQALHAADDPDLDAVHVAARALGEIQAELDSLVVEAMFRERAVLTPEQREHYRSYFPMGRERGRMSRHQDGAGHRPRRGRHEKP
jgi:Spy/CpxP family protein refolding chaperone